MAVLFVRKVFCKMKLLIFALFLPICPVFALSDTEIQDSEIPESECKEQPEIRKSNISADFGIMTDAIKHNGFGLGVNGEYLFGRFISVGGNFSHSVLLSESSEAVFISEILGMNVYCYPFGCGLDKYLYFGGGSSVDFIQLEGEDFADENSRKTAMFLQVTTGWRQPVNQYFGIEAYAGYKKLLYSVDLPKECEHMLDHGFFFGVGINFNFGNIFRSIRNHTRK